MLRAADSASQDDPPKAGGDEEATRRRIKTVLLEYKDNDDLKEGIQEMRELLELGGVDFVLQAVLEEAVCLDWRGPGPSLMVKLIQALLRDGVVKPAELGTAIQRTEEQVDELKMDYGRQVPINLQAFAAAGPGCVPAGAAWMKRYTAELSRTSTFVTTLIVESGGGGGEDGDSVEQCVATLLPSLCMVLEGNTALGVDALRAVISLRGSVNGSPTMLLHWFRELARVGALLPAAFLEWREDPNCDSEYLEELAEFFATLATSADE